MAAIRVLIGDMPPMLQSLVIEMLQDEDDIVVIGRAGVTGDPVDVMLLSTDDLLASSTTIGEIAALSPSGIVSIDGNVRNATIIHLKQQRWPFNDSEKDSISAAIRAAAEPGWKH